MTTTSAPAETTPVVPALTLETATAAYEKAVAAGKVQQPSYPDLPALPPKEGPARDESGKFTAKADEKEPEDAEATEEKGTKPDSKLTALKRAKVPQSVIDSLGEDVLSAWNAELAQDQAKTDKLLRQRGQVEEDSETQADPVDAEQASGSPDVLADLAEEFEALGYTKEEQQLFGTMIEKRLAPVIEYANELQEAARTAMDVTVQAAAQSARTQLEAEFPEMRDNAVWQKIRARAQKQWEQTDDYDNHDIHTGALEAVKDAAIHVLNRARSNATQDRNRSRDASQPRFGGQVDKNLAWKGMRRGELTYRLMDEGHTPQEAATIANDLGLKD